MEDKISMYQFD